MEIIPKHAAIKQAIPFLPQAEKGIAFICIGAF